MSRKYIGYGIFFLILTGGFFVFLFAGTDNWKSKVPTIGYVQPFSFTTQDNQPFTQKDMLGKVTVVEYFFTTCKGICPRMHNSMIGIYEEFKNEPDFLIVAHTVQPEIDTLARLKFYADSLKIDTKKWVLLTGRKDSLYQMARTSYMLDDPKNSVDKLEDQFIHTQFFALADKDGNIRGGVYDALKKDDIKRLKKNITELLKEKSQKTASL